MHVLLCCILVHIYALPAIDWGTLCPHLGGPGWSEHSLRSTSGTPHGQQADLRTMSPINRTSGRYVNSRHLVEVEIREAC